MKSAELRQKFLDYFESKGHTKVPSSSLLPHNDPTLLFTNSGMVQFKDVFLGLESKPYTRATSSQRSLRAGGKHNDLENVGYTARHHTFFEMLGNFSFGDYFKREAIQYAWEFLTVVLKLPKEKLWVTLFAGDESVPRDDETRNIWVNEIGVDPNRISLCGKKDNFWSMGDIGPCGPCTEIFYDHGADIPGGPPGSPEEDGDRYIEIWNVVFMQFERNAKGELKPLAKQCVDTGMGLERVSAVLQGVHNNYEIDLFAHLINAASQLTGEKNQEHASLRVIADHIRACSFLIVDGILPSNEGRGYVLRRITRRALRHGNKLGAEKFFYKLVAPLVEVMGDAYPDLRTMQTRIEEVLRKEEEQFSKTLTQGMAILNEVMKNLKTSVIPGDVVFQLYDTYGFPADLTADVAREKDLTIDELGFVECMRKQRERSKEASQFAMDEDVLLDIDGTTEFSGYHQLKDQGKVIGLFQAGAAISELLNGDRAIVVLDCTPFYAQGGGQVGDKGSLQFSEGEFVVHNTVKIGKAYAHHGQLVRGQVKFGDVAEAFVDETERRATAANHSATHLLHEALRRILGEHVMQKGSSVDAKRLRFDFTHNAPVTREQIHEVEILVNNEVRANHGAVTDELSLDQAKKSGAMALFGEKYSDVVRVLTLGEFSKEICGGTHVKRTGDIGLFKIVHEEGVAAGIRRLEAFTGAAALAWVAERLNQLGMAASILKAKPDDLADRVETLIGKQHELEKDFEKVKSKLMVASLDGLLSKVKVHGGISVLSVKVDDYSQRDLRELLDHLRNRLNTCVILLASVMDGKVQLIAGVKGTDKVHAGKLMQGLVPLIGGNGGGKADVAQGAGSDQNRLHEVLERVYDYVSG